MMRMGSAKRSDYTLILVTVIILLIGILAVYSTAPQQDKTNLCLRHSLFVLVGLGLLFIASRINYQLYYQYARHAYIFSILLLILVLIIGKEVKGSRSWFFIGSFSFQPVELTKLTTVLFLSRVILEVKKRTDRPTSLLKPIVFAIIPVGLILLQPDLGSSIIFFPILVVFLYLGGFALPIISSILFIGGLGLGIPLFITWVNLSQTEYGFGILKRLSIYLSNFSQTLILLLVVVALIGVVFYTGKKYLMTRWKSANFIWISIIITIGVMLSHIIRLLIKTYQQQRLIAFLNPTIDPLGTGYQIIQSEIAIGSGGVFGKGLMAGTQSQLGFLPVQHTDFIFASLAEELGFVGAGLILLLYLIFIWRGIGIALNSRDQYGTYLAMGFVCMYLFPIILNIGMVMGIMPVTGIPLPLLSYGGSSLTVSLLGVGILLNIYRRRYIH